MSGAETQLQPTDPVGGDLTDLVADVAAMITVEGPGPQSVAERAAEWEIELTDEGLPEELAHNAYLPTFIEAEAAIATLKAQHEAARADLAEARSALDAAGQRLALDPSPSEADVIGREALKVAQAEARIRAYETVVIPGAEARLKESDAQRRYLRQAVDVARAEKELRYFLHILQVWEAYLTATSNVLSHLRASERRFHNHLRPHQDRGLLSPLAYTGDGLIPGGRLGAPASRDFWELFSENSRPIADYRNPQLPLGELALARAQAFIPVQVSAEALRKAKELEAEEGVAGQ